MLKELIQKNHPCNKVNVKREGLCPLFREIAHIWSEYWFERIVTDRVWGVDAGMGVEKTHTDNDTTLDAIIIPISLYPQGHLISRDPLNSFFSA
jgi:hypothetical protein